MAAAAAGMAAWGRAAWAARAAVRLPIRRAVAHRAYSDSGGGKRARGLSPYDGYMEAVERQLIVADPGQVQAVSHLADLYDVLAQHTPHQLEDMDARVLERCAVAQREEQIATLQRLLDEREELRRTTADDPLAAKVPSTPVAMPDRMVASLQPLAVQPRGVYLCGPVGCGKSMLMDMFFDNAPVEDERKLRIHFHSFTRDMYAHLFKLNTMSTEQQKAAYGYDMVKPLAKAIARQSYLICFDEMQIPDVGTASLLYRLFQHLFDYGVVLVATSNRRPEALYQGHFKEQLFDPFVETLNTHLTVVELESRRDYRVAMMEDAAEAAQFGETFHVGPTAAATVHGRWRAAVGDEEVLTDSVSVFGREVLIPECTDGGVARFPFDYICGHALGPADYLAIARRFHTVFLCDVPAFSTARLDEARRLISLIDALYECKCQLICSSERDPGLLFESVSGDDADMLDAMFKETIGDLYGEMAKAREKKGEQGPVVDAPSQAYKAYLFTGAEEKFASQRCVSRIQEMRSPQYQLQAHQPALGSVGLDAVALEFDVQGHPTAGTPDATALAEPDLRPRKPVFGSRHFWGSDWWEKFRSKPTDE